MIKKCEQCGREFKAPPEQKYCSCECYRKNRMRQRQEVMPRCKICGKPLKSSRRIYCSKKCAGLSYQKKNGTLCWDCVNANDNCLWHSSEHRPVPGWRATPTKVKMTSVNGRERYEGSYIVHECPEFKAERWKK